MDILPTNQTDLNTLPDEMIIEIFNNSFNNRLLLVNSKFRNLYKSTYPYKRELLNETLWHWYDYPTLAIIKLLSYQLNEDTYQKIMFIISQNTTTNIPIPILIFIKRIIPKANPQNITYVLKLVSYFLRKIEVVDDPTWDEIWKIIPTTGTYQLYKILVSTYLKNHDATLNNISNLVGGMDQYTITNIFRKIYELNDRFHQEYVSIIINQGSKYGNVELFQFIFNRSIHHEKRSQIHDEIYNLKIKITYIENILKYREGQELQEKSDELIKLKEQQQVKQNNEFSSWISELSYRYIRKNDIKILQNLIETDNLDLLKFLLGKQSMVDILRISTIDWNNIYSQEMFEFIMGLLYSGRKRIGIINREILHNAIRNNNILFVQYLETNSYLFKENSTFTKIFFIREYLHTLINGNVNTKTIIYLIDNYIIIYDVMGTHEPHEPYIPDIVKASLENENIDIVKYIYQRIHFMASYKERISYITNEILEIINKTDTLYDLVIHYNMNMIEELKELFNISPQWSEIMDKLLNNMPVRSSICSFEYVLTKITEYSNLIEKIKEKNLLYLLPIIQKKLEVPTYSYY